VWVNTHGSFVLGIAWLGAVIVGEAIDGRRVPVERLRQAAWFAAGLLAGAINPLGPRLLLFPLAVGDKSTVFRRVVEWRSPDFQMFGGTFTLVFLALGLIILLRARPAWRDLLPIVGVLVLGLIAVRNLPLVGIAIAPALGRALRSRREGVTDGDGEGADRDVAVDRRPHEVSRIFVGAFAAVTLLFVAASWRQTPLKLSGYPDAEFTALEQDGLLAAPHRVAAQDFVGNYLELRYGTRVPVLVDDRVDMFPVQVSDDYYQLLGGGPRALDVLDADKVDVVVWRDDKPLVALLKATGAWNERSHVKGWVVYTRR
jgi:hypothetical protein